MKREKCDWFNDKPKKKTDFTDKSLKLAGGALLLGTSLAVVNKVLE